MKKRFKLQQYRKGFWISICCIVLLSCIFLAVSNFSMLPAKQLLEETNAHSKEVADALYEMELNFDQYGKLLNRLLENELLTHNIDAERDAKGTLLHKQLNIVLRQFTEERSVASGYFFKLNSDTPSTEDEVYYNRYTQKKSHISIMMSTAEIRNINNLLLQEGSPVWNTLYNALTDSVFLQYIIPLFEKGQYIGFIGITVDMDYLERLIVTANDRKNSLLTSSKEVLLHPDYKAGESAANLYNGILIPFLRENKTADTTRLKNNNGDYYLYAYSTLPSGQIFLETQKLSDRMLRTNFLTLCVVGISILIILLVQKNQKTGKTTFDNIAGILMTLADKRLLTEDQKNRMKAIIALELGICMTLTFYGLYLLIFARNYLAFACCILTSIVIHFYLYRYIRGFLREFSAFLGICVLLAVTVLTHVLNGGFGAEGTGAIIVWMTVVLVLGFFLLSPKMAARVFNIFVIMLFAEVMIELYFLQNIYYERMFVFVTTLFYVGFSLYTAVSLYLQESIAEGKRISDLLEEVRETQSYLAQQEKMAALGQLISGVAHEINTPIGAIKGAAQTMESGLLPMIKLLYRCQEEFEERDYDCFFTLIKMSASETKEMKNTVEIRQAKKELESYFKETALPNREEILEMLIRLEITDINTIKENKTIFQNPDLDDILKIVASLSGFIVGIQTAFFATGRVSRIVFALKSYAHTSISNEMVEIDIVKNIENILILYHNQLKQNIVVHKEYDADIPHIMGRPDELAQVWTNLIQNAIYAMKDGGTLTIDIHLQEENRLEVKIKDTGVGIPPDIISRIYEPFFTTKPLGEGSGIGLDISQKVIISHGGKIHAESEPMKGTAFYVELPVGITTIGKLDRG